MWPLPGALSVVWFSQHEHCVLTLGGTCGVELWGQVRSPESEAWGPGATLSKMISWLCGNRTCLQNIHICSGSPILNWLARAHKYAFQKMPFENKEKKGKSDGTCQVGNLGTDQPCFPQKRLCVSLCRCFTKDAMLGSHRRLQRVNQFQNKGVWTSSPESLWPPLR